MFAMLQVVDAYALIGDVSGLAEKIQSFFMQEVISETHSVLKSIVHEVCFNINVLAIQTIDSGEYKYGAPQSFNLQLNYNILFVY